MFSSRSAAVLSFLVRCNAKKKKKKRVKKDILYRESGGHEGRGFYHWGKRVHNTWGVLPLKEIRVGKPEISWEGTEGAHPLFWGSDTASMEVWGKSGLVERRARRVTQRSARPRQAWIYCWRQKGKMLMRFKLVELKAPSLIWQVFRRATARQRRDATLCACGV